MTTNYLAGASLNEAHELAQDAREILKEYSSFLRAKGLQPLEPEPITADAKVLQAEIQNQLDALAAVPVGQPESIQENTLYKIFETLSAHHQRELTQQARAQKQAAYNAAQIADEKARVNFLALVDREEQQAAAQDEREAAHAQLIQTIQTIKKELP